LPKPGDSRVGLELEIFPESAPQAGISFQHTVGIATHGAELESIKDSPGPDHSPAIKNRGSVAQQDQDEDQEQQWRKQHDEQQGPGKIHRSLDAAAAAQPDGSAGVERIAG